MASKANDQPSPADVVIEPADLRFEVSLSRASIQHLALRNLACGRPVAFKIKTTNPKRYLVRPNAGIVWAEGAATVSVQVGVQKALPQPGDPKSRDKFQVLTLPLDKALTEEMLAAHGQGNEALRARVAALWASDAAKAAWVDKVRSSLVAADSGGVRGLSIPEERPLSPFASGNGPAQAAATPYHPALGTPSGNGGRAGGAPASSPVPLAESLGPRDALSPRDAISSSPLVDQVATGKPQTPPSAPPAAPRSAATGASSGSAAEAEGLRAQLDASEATRRAMRQQMAGALAEYEQERSAHARELAAAREESEATAAALRKALEQERAIAAGLRQARASPSAASGAPSSQSGGISATTVALIALAAAAAGALLPLFLSPAASLDAPPFDAPPLDAGAGGV